MNQPTYELFRTVTHNRIGPLYLKGQIVTRLNDYRPISNWTEPLILTYLVTELADLLTVSHGAIDRLRATERTYQMGAKCNPSTERHRMVRLGGSSFPVNNYFLQIQLGHSLFYPSYEIFNKSTINIQVSEVPLWLAPVPRPRPPHIERYLVPGIKAHTYCRGMANDSELRNLT